MFDLVITNPNENIMECTSDHIQAKRAELSVVPVKFVDSKTGDIQDPITIMKLGKF